MTVGRRKKTGKLQALCSAGSSTLALVLAGGGVMTLTATPAMAACDATAPTTGQTVICDASPPNPETDGIVIPEGSTDIHISILPGAILETSGGPALNVGVGAHDQYLDNQGIIRTIGNNAPAILIAPDGLTDGDAMTLTSGFFGVVETSGNDSPGVVYGEVGYGAFVMLDGPRATIATAGDRSPGYVFNGMGTTGSGGAFVGAAGHTVSVNTQGHDSAGVIFNVWGGNMVTQEALFVDFNLTANTSGDRSPGVIFGATQTSTPGASISSFQATDIPVDITTQGNDSIGFFFGPGVVPPGDFNIAFVSVGGGRVVTYGDNSHGIVYTEGLSNAQPGQNVNITISNLPADVTTSGDNAHGIILGDGLGTDRTDMDYVSTLRIGSGMSATTSGAGSHALVISEHTTLTLDDANIGATTANGTIVNGTIGTFDGFVATGAGSRAVMNHGILYGTFTVDAAVAGNLGNNGLIESAVAGVAVQFTGTTDDIFELQTEGVVIGTVEAGLGTDTFILGGMGAASFDVGLLGTQYNDFDVFEKTGLSTWTLDGSNTVAGPFLLSEGTLIQNATLDNILMTINSGGTLAGSGTIGGLTLNEGTLAPGNSIGTLTVVGEATFNDGSTYVVELNDGGNVPGINNDLVVADTATINGGAIFHVVPENGTDTGTTYAPSTQYTIIQTAGSGSLTVNGVPTITDSFAFLSFTGSHDGQNYYLTSSAPAPSFCLAGASFNQCSTGEAVNDLGMGHIAYDTVVSMGETDANAAFNALSGEIHASGQQVIDQSFSLFSRTLRGGRVLTVPLDYLSGRPGVAAMDDTTSSANAASAWAAPLGGYGDIDADGNAGEIDWRMAGIAGGYEGLIDMAGGKAYAGFGLGYLRNRGSVDARLSSFDSDSFHIGVYGGWLDGPWRLSGSLAYAANRVSTERHIVFGSIDQMAEADYTSHTIGFSGEAAYGFDLGNGITISPLFTLDTGWSRHGSFTETGAGALNLTGTSESWTRLDTGLGLALSRAIVSDSRQITLDGQLLWEHAFADVVPSQDFTFAGSPTVFEVRGPDAGRDRMRVGLGMSVKASNTVTLRAGYTGLFSGEQKSHGAIVGVGVKF